MRQDYKEAKKQAEAAVRNAVKNGASPYLPVLDSLEETKNTAGEISLGLLELPLSRITGNKELGRNNAFANNFMPLMDENSEFAMKWSDLYDSYKNEGIRDAIRAYEYMNQYYVLEGNKRVSVSKFGGSEFILADVVRILPKKSDEKEVRLYYEYLKFYRSTGNYYLVFSEPKSYAQLASLLGQELDEKWDQSVCSDLKAAFFKFSKECRSALDIKDDYVLSDAFLMYITIFPMKTLFSNSREQILKNIKMARRELMSSFKIEGIEYVDHAPESVKKSIVSSIFSPQKKYTAASPLRVGFIYDAEIEESRWINSHEAGRLYVEEMCGENVATSYYLADTPGSNAAAIDEAIKAGCEVIFTVSPAMLEDTLKAAVHHQDVKFLNCAQARPHSSVKCYHGKRYEADFLMGILSADILLREGGNERRIGYLARVKDDAEISSINAFAVGVSMIDPECTVLLRYTGDSDEETIKNEWKNAGVKMYADIDYPTVKGRLGKPGVFRFDGDKEVYIGRPYFNWGKFYSQIVQSVICGSWQAIDMMDDYVARNLWFGLDTGVVDVIAPKLAYQTRKLLSFFKYAIVNGALDPFSGELHSQYGTVQTDPAGSRSGFTLELAKMPANRIVSMNWLNDNIEDDPPFLPEL